MADSSGESMGRRIVRAIWLPITGVCLTLVGLGAVTSIADPASLHSLKVAQRDRQAIEDRRQADLERRLGDAGPVLDAGAFVRGRYLFGQTCATCHGPDGRGIPAVGGKDLMVNEFVTTRSDAELVAFVIAGRTMDDPLNTTNIPMPPRGANPDLTDEHIADIVAYLRGLQDPRRIPDGPLPIVVPAQP